MISVGSLKAQVGSGIREALIPVGRWLSREQRRELESLAAYGGLVHQAFHSEPFRPWVCPDVVLEGRWEPWTSLQPTESPSRRERDNAVHHYGHDVVLKRAAGLPLVGRPLPFMLEHGVNFSEAASYEDPLPWVRTYLCMGPGRAERLRRRFGVNAVAVGPYIHYARSVLSPPWHERLKQQLGNTLLVIPTHSVHNVDRRWSAADLVRLVLDYCQRNQVDSVIWQGFWKDPVPEGLPSGWILACNGHASNPWFLDCQKTLLELTDRVLTTSLGSHVGYAMAMRRPILIVPLHIQQDVSAASGLWQHRYESEWQERAVLMRQLGLNPKCLWPQLFNEEEARCILDPFFGFDRTMQAGALAACLNGQQ